MKVRIAYCGLGRTRTSLFRVRKAGVVERVVERIVGYHAMQRTVLVSR